MTYFKELISHYERVLLIQPNSAKAHHQLAKIYTSQGDFERSFQQNLAAIQANPTNYLPYSYLRFILLCTNHLHLSIDSGQIEAAIQIIRPLVARQFYLLAACLLLSNLLSQIGKIGEAIPY